MATNASNSKTTIIVNQTVGATTIDVANSLVDSGHDVELLYGSILESSASLAEQVVRRRYCAYSKTSNWQRVTTWLRFWLATLINLLLRRGQFRLVTYSNPPFNSWTGLLIKKIRGVGYCNVIFDLYPDALVQYGILSRDGLLARCWRKLNAASIHNSCYTITLSESLSAGLKKQSPSSAPVVIPNWANTNRIQPVEKLRNRFLSEHGLSNKKVILYSGNLGRTHDLESILECAALLADNPSLHFVIIGEGEKAESVRSAALETGNISSFPFQPPEIFPHSIACGDVAIVSLQEEASEVSIPSKTYSYLAAGTPVIAITSATSELAGLIHETKAGYVAPLHSPNELANIVQEVLDDPDQRRELATAARNASYSYSIANADKIRDLVSGV
ncbi:MAG: glycosyltransferase family 4 protein [Aureliella sp.]